MPTVNVDKEELYAILGKEYTTDEFRELCFEFGIELEEDTSVKEMMTKERGSDKAEGLSDRPLLKIDIPANRYDLLCIEGISRALNIFLGKAEVPTYKMTSPSSLIQIVNHSSTGQIRPFVVGAVLRNITFTQSRYESFIDLQDKLHNNLCRKRTLVAIGTHDLDTIQSPFNYEALPPKDIVFTPLNQKKEMDGKALMEFYEADRHISKFLPIIRDSPVYPVIFDAQRRVCSLPPIINGDHSKISVNTRNVFIECTATDLTKAKTVVNTIVAMFSQYCDEPFTIEPVEIVNADGTRERYPQMEPRTLDAKVDYINSAAGVQLTSAQVIGHLARMSLPATEKTPGVLEVVIPATRSDVLHACDVMEDVAIAYGFNNLAKTLPQSSTVGAPLPINKLTDFMRRELALGGWDEVLSLILCSHDENFAHLHRKDPGAYAVQLANPKTAEYQVVRTSLLPGLLKTVAQNRKYALPLKLFEVQDVAFIDESMERRSRNQRNVASVYVNKTSGFEIVHGLLDRLMAMLNVPLVSHSAMSTLSGPFYAINAINDETYFPGRAASIYYCCPRKSGSSAELIGSFGILHPGVLKNFDIDYVATALEFNLEPFL
ncbi:phenylalanine--tRNA ligase subunit beta [Entomophthora muscae]|uniref:Phenylalanine--tRNA ligase subunit beta n=1 Tax=Entomophthora muscae TaxID=34485 RepID=A0ACC2UT92_9FUNG|nr:phenylalanine--tRNA ligase subunit beta [Entomophthora muscae]